MIVMLRMRKKLSRAIVANCNKLCYRKLFFYKKGSYQRSGKIHGFCLNNKLHRLKLKILR